MVLCLAMTGVLGVMMAPSSLVGQMDLEPEGSDLYPVNDYGWLTLYMHAVYERYTTGKASFDKGDVELAAANLEVMGLFADASKEHLPDKLQDGKDFDKKGYVESVDKLKEHAADVVKNKKWPPVPEGQLDPMMQTCVGCHAAYNIPTDFRLDNKFKKITHVMHQVYDNYRLAGSLLKEKKWDQAKSCFLVVAPYIEEIPGNIPEANQDGEKIDKETFMKVYRQLKQFNDDKIKKLTTKSFEGGKPLPPPRVVMDNCKVCHANAQIDPPW